MIYNTKIQNHELTDNTKDIAQGCNYHWESDDGCDALLNNKQTLPQFAKAQGNMGRIAIERDLSTGRYYNNAMLSFDCYLFKSSAFFWHGIRTLGSSSSILDV